MYGSYGDLEGMDDSLRSFVRRHPDYNPAADLDLSDEEKAVVSIAMFQVAVQGGSQEDIVSAAGLVSFFAIIVNGVNMSPDDRGGGGGSELIQYGDHTIRQSTLDNLGVAREDMHNALRLIREENGLPNSFHGNIAANGNYIDPATGRVLGNIYHYTP